MILHRLRLKNFRGVADREVEFPDRGVAVICGPNEIGKSSMLEALDLLIKYKDSSTSQPVRQVQPTHAGVGSEVEAEISTGPYRFVYRKRFHRNRETHLEIVTPRRDNDSGDDAHARVEAMLQETIDTELWEVQRVLQATSTGPVDLSGCDGLTRALDVAAGEAAAAPGGEQLLIDRITTEYRRYFTATGRPTGEWKTVITALDSAERDCKDCLAAVDEVEQRMSRHEGLAAALRELEAKVSPANARLAEANRAAEAIAKVETELAAAQLAASTAEAASVKSVTAHEQRQQLIDQLASRTDTLSSIGADLRAATEHAVAARDTAATAAAAADQAAEALTVAEQRVARAQAAVDGCNARQELKRIAAKLMLIDQAQTDIERVATELAGIALTEAGLDDIDRAAGLIERLSARLDADAGSVEFTAPADLTVLVDGEPQTLAAGQSLSRLASAPVTVEVPGVLTVRIQPGASATELRAELDAARTVLAEALTRAGVADLTAAHAAGAQRRSLAAQLASLTATLEGLRAGDDIEQLRARLTELEAAVVDAGTDDAAAVQGLTDATAALEAARAEAAARKDASEAAAAGVTEKALACELLRSSATTAEQESTAATAKLSELRAVAADEDVAAAAQADAAAFTAAQSELTLLTARYQGANPDAVKAELATAAAAVESLLLERDSTAADLRDLGVELNVLGGEGRQGKLDEAESLLRRTRLEHARIQHRAIAAQVLRETMQRHRDNTRQRYVQPFRAELERLSRPVFGDDFEVAVEPDLTVSTRTVGGRTVPYDSLSMGAKEQLGILMRLAGGALVDEKQTVPVILDDALGFADSERLDKMCKVLSDCGENGQVIVLTCQRDRYAGVPGAAFIELV